ncbi:hypothetical protein GCM10007304_17840 [Rhodococcoides trifolii]|uniref:Uncharacterized protein n=1 Tax=Rhodococcoides trifolii TaxID=908250 RepID=A0A917FV57_9NOCA|nr:hypothetical protein [Rhodococcus trifolii]GGG04139.1 hypothetical protein GCM10007304_17840 [Rhodococcus trifolii]
MTTKVKLTLLALSVPATVIVLGSLWQHLMDWDFTQPQATIIAGLIGGPFLLAAAAIAFQGQKETRQDERDKFEKQLKFERDNFDRQMKEQRRQSKEQLEMQANVADANNATLLRSEEKKHRRQVTFETVGKATESLIALRTAYVAIDKAVDLDEQTARDRKEWLELEGAFTENVDAAIAACEVARADLTAVAATLLILEYEDSYLALMQASEYVARQYQGGTARSATFANIHEFGILFTAAVDSLRGKYESA